MRLWERRWSPFSDAWQRYQTLGPGNQTSISGDFALDLVGTGERSNDDGPYSFVRRKILAQVEGTLGLCSGPASPRYHDFPHLGRGPFWELQGALIGWVERVVPEQPVNAAVDGKRAGQSEDAAGNPLGMVNVLAHDLKLCLAQWPMTEKRYEPAVLRTQLAQLFEHYPSLQLLTMDALYAERDLCQTIVNYGRDYLVRVKGNRPTVLAALADGFSEDQLGEPQAQTVDKGGKVETRRLWASTVLAGYIREELGFPGAQQGAVVEKVSVEIATGEVSKERNQSTFQKMQPRRTAPAVPQPLER